ncbi:MAG: hypothetical protein VX910_05380 [Candidatus Latescibacterota bacterium]|nr:hypothetical protein [Candidatus Latescibacterota bacterium]
MLCFFYDSPTSVSASIWLNGELSDGDVCGWVGMALDDVKVASIVFDPHLKKKYRRPQLFATKRQ